MPEANLQYDASKNYGDWHLRNSNPEGFTDAVELGEADSKPRNTLVKRPIPLWKDYRVSDYENVNEMFS